MEQTGTIIAVLPPTSGTSQRTGNAWMKQEYVMEIPGQYPRHMAFTVFGEDRIKQMNLRQGEQQVTIQFDIDAHEYNGRWFNEIRAYNALHAQQPVVQQQPFNSGQPAPSAAQAAQQNPFPPSEPKQDDLPF